MDDLLFYVIFNSISVTDYVRVIMMELFLRLERSPLQGGIKPGMDNYLPFHILSNSISIISPSPLQRGIKSGMDNLLFHVLSNSILIISPPPQLHGGGSNQGWIICHFTFFQTVFRSNSPLPPPPHSRGGSNQGWMDG